MSAEELPEGWVWATLGELCGETGLFCDGDWVESKDQDPDGGVRLIQLADIGDGSYRDRSDRFLTAEKAAELGCTFLKPGDVLISRLADPIGRACIFPGDSKPCVTVVDVAIVRGSHFEARWLMSFINSGYFRRTVDEASSGTTRKRISRANLGALALPLPPLEEQQRIVARIEALQARSDAARAALDAIPPRLEALRRSILAAAFRGDLTQEWRAQHPEVEPATALLERIRAERKQRWEAANPKKKYVAPEPVDDSELPDLPEGWCWASVDELAESRAYGTSAKSSEEGRMPVLRMGNIQNGDIDWSDLKFTDDEDEIRQYALAPDAVLFNRTNSPELVGKTALYRGERPAICAGYLIAVTMVGEVVADFVNLVLNSPWGRDWCWQVKSDGVSQSNISGSKLGTFPVPLCSTAEQQEITRIVRQLLAAANSFEQTMTEGVAVADRLNQSILTRAFRGELVPQDPTDEPAETLLARIRAERGAAEKPRRGRRAGA